MNIAEQKKLSDQLKETAEIIDQNIKEAITKEVVEKFKLDSLHENFIWQLKESNVSPVDRGHGLVLYGTPKNEFGRALIEFYSTAERDQVFWERLHAIDFFAERSMGRSPYGIFAGCAGAHITEIFIRQPWPVVIEFLNKPGVSLDPEFNYDTVFNAIALSEKGLQEERNLLDKLKGAFQSHSEATPRALPCACPIVAR